VVASRWAILSCADLVTKNLAILYGTRLYEYPYLRKHPMFFLENQFKINLEIKIIIDIKINLQINFKVDFKSLRSVSFWL